MRLPDGNPMVRVLMVTLLFEMIVFGFAIPGMIQVSDRSLGVSFGFGGAAMLLAAVAAFTLKRGIGWPLGWLTQVAGIALGLLTPYMFVMGGVFTGLYVLIFVLGRRLEAHAAARAN